MNEKQNRHMHWHTEARVKLRELVATLKRRRHASRALNDLFLRLSAIDEHCEAAIVEAEHRDLLREIFPDA